jgi:hypothetical protein
VAANDQNTETCKAKILPSILPARLDWPSAIGNFLLNFGTLEYFVFVFLKDSLTPEEFAKVKEWHFKDRLNRIARLLVEGRYPTAKHDEFTQLVERIEQLRELRNHIAHGHMLLRVDPDTTTPTVTLFKAKDLDREALPDSKHLNFDELRTSLTMLTEVIEHLGKLVDVQTTTFSVPLTDQKNTGANALVRDHLTSNPQNHRC